MTEPYPKLVLDKFNVGMVDEQIVSKMIYPEGAAISAVNVYYTPTGALTKRPGVEARHTTSPCCAAITKIYQWATPAGTDYTFAFSASGADLSASLFSVYTTASSAAEFSAVELTGTTWEPTEVQPISITSWGGSAVMTYVGCKDGPSTYDGTNAFTLTAAPSGCRALVGYGNYLIVGNYEVGAVRKGSRVGWCYPGNAESWPASWWLELDADDGDEITAMANFQNMVVVWKRYKMFILHYVGGTYMFKDERLSTSIGCLGPNGWYDDGSYLYFIADDGAYRWNGQGPPVCISDQIQKTFEAVNPNYRKICEVSGYSDDNQVWFCVPIGASQSTKNRVFVFDTLHTAWSIYTLSIAGMGPILYGANVDYANMTSNWITYGQKYEDLINEGAEVLMIGTYSGFMGSYDTTTDDFGAIVDGYWVSRWLDMEKPDITKRIMRLTFFVDREGSYSVDAEICRDWNFTTRTTKTISLYDASYATGMIEKRADFTLQGRSFRFQFGTDDSGSPYTIHKVMIEYVMKGRTKV